MSRGKGKTLFAIFAFCTVLAEVSSLTCYQCNALSGHCEPQRIICKPDITTCRTISSKQVVAGVTSSRISNSCGPCSEPIYFSTGVVSVSKISRCCDSDLCNNQTVADAPNTTQSGLECRGCFNSSADSCSASEETVKCVGLETRCMNVSGQQALMPIGLPFFARGCASELCCQSTSVFRDFRMQVNELPACCVGNLCNGDARSVATTHPGDRTSSTATPGTSTQRPTDNGGDRTSSTATPGTSTQRPTDNGGDRTNSTVTPGTSTQRPTDNGASVGCIVGTVVGLGAGVLILLLICWCCWKRNRDTDSGPV